MNSMANRVVEASEKFIAQPIFYTNNKFIFFLLPFDYV